MRLGSISSAESSHSDLEKKINTVFSCRWSADDYDVKPFVSPCDSDHIIFFGEFEKWYHFKWNNLLLYCINPFSLPLNCLDGIWEFTFLSGAYNQEILTFGHSKPLAVVHLCSWNKNADLPIIWSCMVWVDIYAIFICLSNYVTLAAGFIEDMQKKIDRSVENNIDASFTEMLDVYVEKKNNHSFLFS